eukprot:3351314-Rhodomonas_salina.1
MGLGRKHGGCEMCEQQELTCGWRGVRAARADMLIAVRAARAGGDGSAAPRSTEPHRARLRQQHPRGLRQRA